jgi:hypothetical protein
MGVWDQLRKAKMAGQRFLERIDEVEREARDGDPDKEARRLAFKHTETEVTGGVADLASLAIGPDSLGDELELLVEDDEEDIPFFLDLEPSHVDEEVLGIEEVLLDELSIELELTGTDPDGVPRLSYLDDATVVDVGALDGPGELTQIGEKTAIGFRGIDGERTMTVELTQTGELTATGEGTSSLVVAFGNSLGFDEKELSTILRCDHYPQLSDQPVHLLVELSRFEQRLMDLGEELGRGAYTLLKKVIPSDEDWEAAVWTTGAHWDHAVRQALVGMDEAENALSTRALGWAFWPFTDELLSAAVGLQDPCGISEVIAKIELVLDERWARVEGGVEHLEAEGDHLPILPRGLFAFEGFRWEA